MIFDHLQTLIIVTFQHKNWFLLLFHFYLKTHSFQLFCFWSFEIKFDCFGNFGQTEVCCMHVRPKKVLPPYYPPNPPLFIQLSPTLLLPIHPATLLSLQINLPSNLNRSNKEHLITKSSYQILTHIFLWNDLRGTKNQINLSFQNIFQEMFRSWL